MASKLLINHPELRIFLQPTLRFPAFVNNVIIHDEGHRFCPPVHRLQLLQQTDKLRLNFAVTAHVADFARSAM